MKTISKIALKLLLISYLGGISSISAAWLEPYKDYSVAAPLTHLAQAPLTGGAVRGLETESVRQYKLSNFNFDQKEFDADTSGATLHAWQAEKIADILLLEHLSLRGSYSVRPCSGKYNSRNGIDSLFVILDSTDKIAKFKADGTVTYNSDPSATSYHAVLVVESKYSRKGTLSLRGASGDLPSQMSYDWISVVVDHMAATDDSVRGCPLLTGSSAKYCSEALCEAVYNILKTPKAKVVRISNLLRGDGICRFYALGDSTAEKNLMRRIMESIFPASTAE
jgi:hypothetical protein